MIQEVGFTVEDGSGIQGANSYIDIDTADNYYTLRAYTEWANFPQEIKIAALIQSSMYVDSQYEWVGERQYEDQGLSFPRTGVYNKQGERVFGVPNAVKRAVLELGKRVVTVDEQQNYTIKELVPDINTTEIVRSIKQKFSVMEQQMTYMTPTEVGAVRPFPSIDALIPKYLVVQDESGNKVFLTSILTTNMDLESIYGTDRNTY